jgi:hypothetical protein
MNKMRKKRLGKWKGKIGSVPLKKQLFLKINNNAGTERSSSGMTAKKESQRHEK